jgi:hypothetical protein
LSTRGTIMILSNSTCRAYGGLTPWFQIKIWHLAMLVAIVALAMCDILDHARNDPVLRVVGAAGYAIYFFLVWLIWLQVRRFEAALGASVLLALFMTAMAAFFFIVTVVYLLFEYAYLGGHFF